MPVPSRPRLRPTRSRLRPPSRRFLIKTLAVILATIGLLAAATQAHGASLQHSARFRNVQTLQHGLAGYPLERSSYAIEAEAHLYNVNPFLIAAIAGVESTFGEHACGGNAWGLNSCRGSRLDSFADGAIMVAQTLRHGYLDAGTRDVWSMGRTYCPPCGDRWGDDVKAFMWSRFRSGPTLTYPR